MGIWRLIAHDEDPDGAIEEMKHRSRIAIGWTAIGDLRQTDVQSPSEITSLISAAYPNLKDAHLGGPSLWNFYRNVEPGDFVIVNGTRGRDCVFEVVGSYFYESENAKIKGYRHQRQACLTDLNPEHLWSRPVASGQNERWTLTGCIEAPKAKEAIYKEGQRYSVVSTAIERNPIARKKCIEHFGCKCYVCEFDFNRVYGQLGGDYIHVHHKTDIATRLGEHEVNPIRDLVPLCANCHAMVHQERPSMSVEKLAAIYAQHSA
jgi:hypothetical protein